MKKIKMSWMAIGTFTICILALLSTVFSIYSMTELKKQINLIYDNTYKVKSEAEAISSRMSEIRTTLPTLLENDNTYQVKHITDMLLQRDEIQDESIELIRAHYLGSPDDIGNLIAAFHKLRAARLVAVDRFSPKNELKDIVKFFESDVDPYENEVNEALTSIKDGADYRIAKTRKEAGDTQKVASTGAILLCICIIILVITTTRAEKRKNREVAYREQLFDLLSNNIEDVFYIYSAKTRAFEYVSKNCSRILGIRSKEFYDETWKLREFLVDGTKYDFDEVFGNGTIFETKECDVKYVNKGRNLDLKLRIYPIIVRGEVEQYIVVLTDQTKTIEQQKVLTDALLSAQRANAAKRDFLSRMSHEIRTPMNTIIGMTAIGLRHIDDLSQIENCLKKITFSSSHLLSLINDILDMSKIEDNKLSVVHDLFDFKKLLESITTIVYPQTAERQQDFEVTISGLTEEMLIGDALRLNQVLLNILSNAIKFTPKGGEIRLDISKVRGRGNKIFLRFAICDTGMGMSEEFLGRLFTPFEQADNSIAQKFGGTGLGMSITKNLVSLMNGTISVKSELNKGTTFTVELPFEITENENIIYNQELTELNILVVDDDQNTCEHAMLLMEEIGINAEWVCSGKEAVEKVINAHNSSDDYDVCFIDWCMPDMNGVETARQIRNQLGPDTIIIIISAYDWSDIEKEARKVGVNAFVSKPIFVSSICNTLNSIILPKSVHKGEEKQNLDFTGKKVLLVEDNMVNQEIATILLNDIGIEVDTAENGQEALEQFKTSAEDEYAMILMDIQMPIMNGYEAARAIRKSSHVRATQIPIIAMTADAFNEDIILAHEAGMNGHIAKPVDVELLYEMVASHIVN